MKVRRTVLMSLLGVPIIVLIVIGVLVLASWRRPELGLVDGRLRPCPGSPNCVCSLASDDEHRIDPLPANGSMLERLRQVLNEMPGVQIIEDDENYLRAECSSSLLRFVDDMEFLYDSEAGVIQVRSASRIGHSDLGANRKRVDAVRQRLAKEPSA